MRRPRSRVGGVGLGFVVLMLAACESQAEPVDTTRQDSPTNITTVETTTTTTTTSIAPEPTVTGTGQAGFADALGSSERVCVDVDQIVATEAPIMVGPDQDWPVFDIRSGEILAGNFAIVVDQWSTFGPRGVIKMYWVPYDHVLARTGSLQVVVEPLDSNNPSETLMFDTIASSSSGAQLPDVLFWPSGARFPEPGRYRLIATAPGHWGCFEVTV